MPEMQYVDSTNIEAVGYDAESLELHVRFAGSGDTYAYYNVPDFVYEELMQADSKGVYLNSQIKGTYEYGKL